nr:G protein-coupled receptor [Proales similis]
MNRSSIEPAVCDVLLQLVTVYVQTAFAGVGILLNTLSALVFWKLLRSNKLNSVMFRYLLIKSICDTYFSIRIFLHTFMQGESGRNKNSSVVLLYLHVILLIYMGFVVQLISMFCDVAASFNRYRSIAMKFKFMDKVPFKLCVLFMVAYPMMFYSHKFFEFQVTRTEEKNASVTRFEIVDSQSFNDRIKEAIGFVHSLVRDGLCVLLLLVINALTFTVMKSSLRRKSLLVHRGSIRTERRDRADVKLTLMVLMNGVMSTISHGLLFVYYLPTQLKSSYCLVSVILIIYSLSYTINFFFYFFLNKNFSRLCKSYINRKSETPIQSRRVSRVETDNLLLKGRAS